MTHFFLFFLLEYIQTFIAELFITYVSLFLESLLWNGLSKQNIKNKEQREVG
jgi:hypothetical protein